MTRIRFFLLPLVLIVLAGGALLLRRAGTGVSEAGTGWLAGDGKPVHLALTFDAGRGRAKTIGPDGGTVTATGADGTHFLLRIPEGALLSPERISLIPVTTVAGLPLHGDGYVAVHLKPDGLRLLRPGVLRITTEREIPVAERIAFAYLGNGRDAHLYPLDPRASRIEMPILHFSGYGFGRAAPQDPGRRALQQAADRHARLETRVAEIFNRLHQKLRGTSTDGDAWADATRELEQIFVQYYDEIVRPLMKTAETDDRMAHCANERFLSWFQMIQLAGLIPREAPSAPRELAAYLSSQLGERLQEGNASLDVSRKHFYEKRFERAIRACREEHDFVPLTNLAQLAREAAIMGGDASAFENLQEEVEKCLTFELEFRSSIELKTPSGGTFHQVAAKATVRVPLITLMKEEPDTATLEYVAFRASGNPVVDLGGSAATPAGDILEEASANISAAGTRPGTLTVLDLSWSTNPITKPGTSCAGEDEAREEEVVGDMHLLLLPGVPVELVRYSPLHAGQQTAMGKAIEQFGHVLGNKEAVEGGRAARVAGPFTDEQTTWANEWAQRRHSHAVKTRSAQGDARDIDQDARPYQIVLQPEPGTTGVWRAVFATRDAPVAGFSATENSHIILRHAPR